MFMKKGVIFLVLVLLGYCAVTGIVTDELIYEKEGWKILCIEGQPYERGFQHGQTLAEEIYEHEMEFINTFIGGENIEKTRAIFRELAMGYWDKVPEEY
jgi:hypothetical protein